MRAFSSGFAGGGALKYSKPATLALVLLPVLAWAQTAPLNDTGQTQCYDGSAMVACTAANAGDDPGVTYPRQDGRFGRDAAQVAGVLPAKTGGGEAGFDFTALNASGNATTPGSHDCVYDNTTRLLWSTEVLSMNWNAAAAAYPSDGSGSYNRCDRTTGWRLPTRRELLSITHRGRSNPTIDPAYFPGYPWAEAEGPDFLAVDPYAPDPAKAWFVSFDDGNTFAYGKTFTFSVRLVRSGQ